MSQKPVLDIREVPSKSKWLLFSIQHLFAMFGATILVPALVGLSPAVALISSGLGTLAYLVITKGQIPAYLGSSFAFIVPIIAVSEVAGPGGAMVGGFLAGVVYGVIAMLIKVLGHQWILNVLPPVVVGPVIIVIGLGLAGVAVGMAMYENPGAAPNELIYSVKHLSIALITLSITIISAIFFRGIFGIIPILIGIIGGYVSAYFAGLVDFSTVLEAGWIEAPSFIFPFVDYSPMVTLTIIGIMVPIAAVTIAEHIGDQMVISKIVGKNLIEKPGLHRSILGDGVASMIAALVGGPPNTTYGENIGVLAITRVFSVFVVGGAAVLAILFGFVGKIAALIGTIPSPVMGGVSILLFGIIASSGLRTMIDNKVDFNEKRNLIITSVILVIGVGGAFIQLGNLQIAGMALAAIIGIALNLILPGKGKTQTETFEEKENTVA
ncbi:solute carrier family 23 protein [Sutcliffiella rhizosphaerae]|uniref:Uracil permease n=1 Tax=Sutcliffiella rhizosphaerae TaxID=2880967 RepID=A0ABN8A5Z8_9BACI|nr:solute carrier family 23 protein [Sutcliffiella rhizosphaerae]CAG9619781.1 Uracil permease [Sutcliffiella rhizosphaerae]